MKKLFTLYTMQRASDLVDMTVLMCLVKQIIPFILDRLKHVCNTSMEKGVFPDAMEIASFQSRSAEFIKLQTDFSAPEIL